MLDSTLHATDDLQSDMKRIAEIVRDNPKFFSDVAGEIEGLSPLQIVILKLNKLIQDELMGEFDLP